MWSVVVILVLVFAVLGLLLGFSEAYGMENTGQALGAYIPPAIHPSLTG